MQFVLKFWFFVLGGAVFECIAQKIFFLQEVLTQSQINTLDEVAADPDTEDNFDSKWCDEDGNLKTAQ